MLIIRRKQDESFVIFSGDTRIEVFVTQIGKNSVKIGIDAGDNIDIYRRELVDKQGFYIVPKNLPDKQ